MATKMSSWSVSSRELVVLLSLRGVTAADLILVLDGVSVAALALLLVTRLGVTATEQSSSGSCFTCMRLSDLSLADSSSNSVACLILNKASSDEVADVFPALRLLP